jgi:hypothetical protein
MTRKFKKYNLIVIITFLISCSNNSVNEKYSFYGYNPSEMTEEEIYMTYGLEAPRSFYQKLIYEMDFKGYGKNKYHSQVKKENPLSHFISIWIVVDSLDIKTVSIEQSDYSNKFNKALENLISGIDWKEIKLDDNITGFFNFRLDINKLFNSKTFEPTLPKDSTLNTRPLLKETLEESRQILKEKLGDDYEKIIKK